MSLGTLTALHPQRAATVVVVVVVKLVVTIALGERTCVAFFDFAVPVLLMMEKR